MSSKNLQEQLSSLSRQLTEAMNAGDEELAADLQDQIWELEDEINDDANELYKNRHTKHGWA